MHLDRVDELGEFVELEVVLGENDTHERGVEIANDVIDRLELSGAERLAVAYADLLVAKRSNVRSFLGYNRSGMRTEYRE